MFTYFQPKRHKLFPPHITHKTAKKPLTIPIIPHKIPRIHTCPHYHNTPPHHTITTSIPQNPHQLSPITSPRHHHSISITYYSTLQTATQKPVRQSGALSHLEHTNIKTITRLSTNNTHTPQSPKKSWQILFTVFSLWWSNLLTLPQQYTRLHTTK